MQWQIFKARKRELWVDILLLSSKTEFLESARLFTNSTRRDSTEELRRDKSLASRVSVPLVGSLVVEIQLERLRDLCFSNNVEEKAGRCRLDRG